MELLGFFFDQFNYIKIKNIFFKFEFALINNTCKYLQVSVKYSKI